MIDPLAVPGNINGLDIQINDLLEDTPKLQFVNQPDSPTVREVNAWLAEMFGYEHPYYQVGRIIITNKTGYEKLRQATRNIHGR